MTDLREKLQRNAPKTDSDQVRLVNKDVIADLESDPEILERRNRDITYGKSTENYMVYRDKIPREDRSRSMPRTPDKYQKMSRRRWDGQIKSWKLNIHKLVNDLDDAESGQIDISNAQTLVIEDWAEHMEQEDRERMRKRSDSCISSDQGIGTLSLFSE